MFTNTNTNFTNVIFNVTDGYQTINPIDVTVTITGNTATVNYDGQSHTVTGYTASCANTLYNVNSNLNFSGEAKATRTNAGTTDMNLSESQFENTNSNFGTVFFNIIDGKMTVNPIAATVTITEHSGTANYDGNEHVVTGYDVAISNALYTANDFTFTGDSTVRGTNADTYAMNLVSTNFTNTNGNFDPVTFNVTDGTLTINPINVTVNITGNTNVATFDAAPHTVTGFTATCENPLYNVHGDFTYSGDSTATQTSVGTKNMGLLASQFTNTNTNFGTVTFSITDGYQSVVAPGAVIVTITEHGGEVNYDGQSHTVTGYDVAISDPLYTESDFTFSGSASVSGTNAGSYPMTLTPDNFTNTNTNFSNVTFVVRDSQLVIKPIEATVTITGANSTVDYDGQPHSVNGYTATASTTLYDVISNIAFSGTAATATRTDAGTTNMGLTNEMFSNISNNFTNVTFNVVDGYQTVSPIDVTVTITEHSGTANYDGNEHVVTGYDVAISNSLYTTNDFTFSGDSTVRGTNAGTYAMELSADDFENTSNNFGTVTFNITDGTLTINPINVAVTITEHSGTANYDGNEHVVTGYDVAISNALYTANDFTFTGDSTVRGTNADTYAMNLVSTNFTNTNGNFDPVTFNVTDGTLTINPINVTVNITGNTNVATFDAAPHTVTGFTATCENPLYNVHGDFTYSGDSTATQTSVGTKNMGLLASQFTNTNTNFGTVTFSITDGYQSVVAPGAVIVTITEHGGEVNYDGQSHTVTGYDVAISDPLYTESDFTFSGSASVSGTNAGSYPMTLTPDNFTNTNTNFDNVTFVIVDGTLTISPITATVTIVGANNTTSYDGAEHSVNGYTATASTDLYDVNDNIVFNGTAATATRTDAGTTNMGLTSEMFSNTNNNFTGVVFQVTDGYQTINPITATVTIVGANNTTDYDGAEHSVNGYTATANPELYDVNSNIVFNGTAATATRTDAGTTNMGLTSEMFSNTNNNFTGVVFQVTDGYQTINPITTTVTIVGTNNTTDYDGADHLVSGYTANCENVLYNVNTDFTFNGTAEASRRNAGTTNMELNAGQFTNTNTNFSTVTFNVTDGYQTINKIAATVTIKGHIDTAQYDAQEHTVRGYDVVEITPSDLYTVNDFSFSGTAEASRTEAGTTNMNLSADQFANTNSNFDNVTFNVTDGHQTIVMPESMVIVDIKGHVDTVIYNGAEQEVVGYDVVNITSEQYSEDDFTFNGTARAARTDVGTTAMGLSGNQFVNNNTDFTNVIFRVVDGWLTVDKRDVTLTGATATLEYNGAQQSITEVTADNLVAGHTWTTSYSASGKDAGSYDGAFSGQNRIKSGNTDVTNNYNITLETGALTITKKALTVNNPIAPLTKVYDGTPFTVNYDVLQFNGLVGSDAITSGTITTDGYQAGTYVCSVGNRWAIAENEGTASINGFGPTEVTRNYAVQFNVTLVIAKRQVTVTAMDSAKVFDGEPLTQSRFMTTSIAETDQIAVTTSGSQTNPGTGINSVASVVITRVDNGEDVTSSYNITTVNGRLKVIDPDNDFTCPDPVTVTLKEGTFDTIVPFYVLGTTTHSMIATGEATLTNNLEQINPMTAGPHVVTWSLVSTGGEEIATCEQTVMVLYTPCEELAYNGYTYPAKRIGYQCWLTENLRTTTDANGNEIANYHAYRDNDENIDKFGYLYSWYSTVGVTEGSDAAVPVTQVGDNGQPYVQGICPAGWAVCTREDYNELAMTVGDALLLKDASTEYWNEGANGVLPNSGFNSRGSGWFNSNRNRYEDLYTGFHFWQSTDDAPGSHSIVNAVISYYCDSLQDETGLKTDLKSVRCIRKVYVPGE